MSYSRLLLRVRKVALVNKFWIRLSKTWKQREVSVYIYIYPTKYYHLSTYHYLPTVLLHCLYIFNYHSLSFLVPPLNFPRDSTIFHVSSTLSFVTNFSYPPPSLFGSFIPSRTAIVHPYLFIPMPFHIIFPSFLLFIFLLSCFYSSIFHPTVFYLFLGVPPFSSLSLPILIYSHLP